MVRTSTSRLPKHAENRQHAYRWLEVSHYLGARQVRIDAGGRDIAAEAIFDIVVDGYKDIVARAQPLGLEVIIENHWGPYQHPDNLYKLLKPFPAWDCSSIPTTGPLAPINKPGCNMPNMPPPPTSKPSDSTSTGTTPIRTSPKSSACSKRLATMAAGASKAARQMATKLERQSRHWHG